ncbi:hypothetical protein A2125_02535 [Candidatus Woesebacteria bacterium GWB1_43_5]|uniref:BioF2-like acetyltransferase domain-containing protein n=1 Tax=Candidatus Woesebacteria bacterium GWB1_43_5 TaxID=1802474 RepID=A0A1F7WUJ3_9BACT|nr:MAG: hypothetical protein A2125_02535 [Candidatus Woesebacteria bacterium GWB1_43_5]
MTHPLQTPVWAEFRRKWGNEVVETPFGFLTLHRLPFTSHKIGMFIKGPEPSKEMLDWLKAEGKKLNVIFIKLEPNQPSSDPGSELKLLESSGSVRGKTLFTPTTFWIDLTKSEEELLASFHPKTRYNIRHAQKKGVEVLEDNSDKAFERYLSLMKETVIRDKFFAHNEKYHRLMWEILHKSLILNHKSPIAHLLVAEYNHEIITAWILFECEGFLYYPYGASTHKYKNVMANNLMMWEAIRFGKRLGCHTFDLWGREPGKGFTRFKEGYNPLVIEFLGTWDLVINKKIYRAYRIAEKIRWITLRLQAELGLTKYRF